MALSCALIHFINLVVIFLILVNVSPITLGKQVYGPKSKHIITRLIHYQVYDSPYFNSSASIEELDRMDMEISFQRINHLKSKTSERKEGESLGNGEDGNIQVGIYTTTVIPLFVVKFEIGTPQLTQVVAMDTGSSLFWIRCDSTGSVDYSIIDQYMQYVPTESSTYSKYVRCDKYCGDGVKCLKDCEYEVWYATGEYSRGEFGSERLFFKSLMSNETILDDIVFGCSMYSNLGQINGILGLNAGRISLISQLKFTEFSYCISNLTNTEYQSNALLLGNNYEIGGEPTPLIIENSQYYVNIEAISFGGRILDIDKQQLKRRAGQRGGALFDSGTSFTLLQQIAYSKVEEATINFVGDRLERQDYTNAQEIRRTCFVGNLHRDFSDFPKVTFQFDGGAYMDLDKENIFKQITDKLVCLNMVAAERHLLRYSIIGVNLQQYFYIAFDLAEEELSFRNWV